MSDEVSTTYLLGVSSLGSQVIYYTSPMPYKVQTEVIIDNPSIGLTYGKVESVREINLEKASSFAPIARAATPEDRRLYDKILKDQENIFEYVSKAVKRYNLDMRVLQTILSLDGTKLLIIYSSDERVDFREIVKEFARTFHTHIEMRQIGTRDRAQIIGGIGVCGLPLCCATFLHNFDVISINMAKNQLLSLNIPKLSGQCGKLVCCLKYEDEAYTELHKNAPRIGDKFKINNQEYKVISMNLITGVITLSNNVENLNLSKEELKKYHQIKNEPTNSK